MTQPPQPPYGEQPQQPPNGEPPQQPPYSQQPQGSPGGYPQPQAKTGPDAAGFFRALFDFSFKSFVTIKFAAVIYGIAMVLIGIFTLIGIIVAFITMTEDGLAGFLALLLVIILAPVYLVLVRLGLEFYVAMVRTAQNTSAINSEIESLRWDLSQKN